MIQSGNISPQIFLPDKNTFNSEIKTQPQVPLEKPDDRFEKYCEYNVPVSYIYVPRNGKKIIPELLNEYTDKNDLEPEIKKDSIRIGLTSHTKQRMAERGISKEDLVNTITYGLVFHDKNYPNTDCFEFEQPDPYMPEKNRIVIAPVYYRSNIPCVATVIPYNTGRTDPPVINDEGYSKSDPPCRNLIRFHRNIRNEIERDKALTEGKPSDLDEGEISEYNDNVKKSPENMLPVSYIYVPAKISQNESLIENKLLKEYSTENEVDASIKKNCNMYGLTLHSKKKLQEGNISVKDLIKTIIDGWIYFDRRHPDRYCYEYEQADPNNSSKKRILKVSVDYVDGIRNIVNIQVYNCSRNDPPIVNGKGHICKSPPCKDIERYHRDLGREDKRNRRLDEQPENIRKEPVEDTIAPVLQANYDKTIIETPPNITDILGENA